MNYPQLNLDKENGPLALIKTNYGDIEIRLFPEQAPMAVENFIKLSEVGYYDGICFHRIIKDFMIQSGDPTDTGAGGESIWNQPFDDEFSEYLYNFRGALSMANAGPNTNGSQFFIVQNNHLEDNLIDPMKKSKFSEKVINAYREYGGAPWLDFRHTVFGQTIKGMDVVDQIANAKVDNSDRPLGNVTINKIEILK
ncbi:peptidylprolyl isomerase [Apilactobacillus apisilvae]|uniref:Peptidyl-prolyl cis-trans isomerase n=1 Tax=Apilactobacillus apisilvae TaxID=2923364 RepID=A0ABY4PJC6_9LACO|nr:peptidylprolyl isomerase [Apilactobacillus apisilvae]UQS85702.1 peptidylprolyl isomerase [Apilactobacillus apisilvae]